MKKYILARVHSYDSWSSPNFVLIIPETIERAKLYSQAIKDMKAKGLMPQTVSESWYGAYWLESLPQFGGELANQIVTDGDDEETINAIKWDSDTVVSSIEELQEFQETSELRIDCGSLDCDENDFHVSCYAKHGVNDLFESTPIRFDDILVPIAELVQEV